MRVSDDAFYGLGLSAAVLSGAPDPRRPSSPSPLPDRRTRRRPRRNAPARGRAPPRGVPATTCDATSGVSGEAGRASRGASRRQAAGGRRRAGAGTEGASERAAREPARAAGSRGQRRLLRSLRPPPRSPQRLRSPAERTRPGPAMASLLKVDQEVKLKVAAPAGAPHPHLNPGLPAAPRAPRPLCLPRGHQLGACSRLGPAPHPGLGTAAGASWAASRPRLGTRPEAHADTCSAPAAAGDSWRRRPRPQAPPDPTLAGRPVWCHGPGLACAGRL